MVDTSDEWIVSRTGIRERHVVGEGESVATMAIEAGKRALADAGVAPEEIELLVARHGDRRSSRFRRPAAIIQPALGIKNATCFDIAAACSGFLYALHIARQFIVTGEVTTAMVIGAETLSRYTDYTDRATCILFGDGAGAAVLQAAPAGEGILRSRAAHRRHLRGLHPDARRRQQVPAQRQGAHRRPAAVHQDERQRDVQGCGPLDHRGVPGGARRRRRDRRRGRACSSRTRPTSGSSPRSGSGSGSRPRRST